MAFGGSGKFYPPIVTGIGYSADREDLHGHHRDPTPYADAGDHAGNIVIEPVRHREHDQVSCTLSPFYILSQIVVLMGLLWSSYLGALAIKEGEKLTMTQALMVVGIPLAIIHDSFHIGPMLLMAYYKCVKAIVRWPFFLHDDNLIAIIGT